MGKKTNPRPKGARQKPSPPDRAAALRLGREPSFAVAANDEATENASTIRARRAEARRLREQGCAVTVDPATSEVLGARRADVFSSLSEHRAKPEREGQLGRPGLDPRVLQAFRDHEADVHLALGAEAGERRPDHIRASVVGAPGQNVSDAMVDAGERVRATLARLIPSDAKLLNALMRPGAAFVPVWRETVRVVTGETRAEAQAARVRSLGENLAARRAEAIKALRPANDRRAQRRLAG